MIRRVDALLPSDAERCVVNPSLRKDLHMKRKKVYEPTMRTTNNKDVVECNFPFRLIDAEKNFELVAGYVGRVTREEEF